MASTSLDAQILDVVKEASPSAAYLMGFNDYAGKLFIASRANIDESLQKVRALRKQARAAIRYPTVENLIELAAAFAHATAGSSSRRPGGTLRLASCDDIVDAKYH